MSNFRGLARFTQFEMAAPGHQDHDFCCRINFSPVTRGTPHRHTSYSISPESHSAGAGGRLCDRLKVRTVVSLLHSESYGLARLVMTRSPKASALDQLFRRTEAPTHRLSPRGGQVHFLVILYHQIFFQ